MKICSRGIIHVEPGGFHPGWALMFNRPICSGPAPSEVYLIVLLLMHICYGGFHQGRFPALVKSDHPYIMLCTLVGELEDVL